MLYVNEVQEDKEADEEIASRITVLREQQTNDELDIMDKLLLERLNSNRDAFSREVSCGVESIMEMYDVNTEDPELLEFDDHTKELQDDYETGEVNCIRLP